MTGTVNAAEACWAPALTVMGMTVLPEAVALGVTVSVRLEPDEVIETPSTGTSPVKLGLA